MTVTLLVTFFPFDLEVVRLVVVSSTGVVSITSVMEAMLVKVDGVAVTVISADDNSVLTGISKSIELSGNSSLGREDGNSESSVTTAAALVVND